MQNIQSTVTPVTATAVQKEDYYPFGLTFNSWTNVAPENLYKFNGNEVQPEIAGVSDFNARFYDGALGRFMMIDPLADANQESWNPYHFSFDNPVQFVDPSGLSPAWSTGFGSSEKTDAEQQMDRLQQAQEEKEKADGFAAVINGILDSQVSLSLGTLENQNLYELSGLQQETKRQKLSRYMNEYIWQIFREKRRVSKLPDTDVEPQGILDAEVDLNQSAGFTPIEVYVPGFVKPKSSIASGIFGFDFSIKVGKKIFKAEGFYSPAGFKVDNTVSRVFYSPNGATGEYPTPIGSPLSGYIFKMTNKRHYEIITIVFKDKAAYNSLAKYLNGE